MKILEANKILGFRCVFCASPELNFVLEDEVSEGGIMRWFTGTIKCSTCENQASFTDKDF